MPACPRREWEAKVRLDDAPRSFRISIMMTCAKAGRGLMSDLDLDVDVDVDGDVIVAVSFI